MAVKSTLASFPITHYMPSTLACLLFIAQPRLVSNSRPWPLFSAVSVVLNKGSCSPSSREKSGNIFGYPNDYPEDPTDIGYGGGSRDAKCPAVLRTDPHKKNNPMPNANSIPLEKT